MRRHLEMTRKWVLTGCGLSGIVAFAACKSSDEPGAKLKRDPSKDLVVVVDERTDGREAIAEEESSEEGASQPVPLGAAVTGSLDGYEDVDRYTITVEADGWLDAKVSGAKDADLKLDIVDESGKTVARSDRGPAGTSEGVRVFPVTKGRYQLHVAEYTKKRTIKAGEGRQGKSANYELVTDLATELKEDSEEEPNESDGKVVEPDASYNGYLGWKNDVDVWKIAFDPSAADQRSWMLEVAGVPGSVLEVKWKESAGEPLALRRSNPGEGLFLGPYQTYTSEYLLEVSGSKNNPEDAYVVRATAYELKPGEEIEPNDAAGRASLLSTEVEGKVFRAIGTLLRGDIDYFQLPSVTSPSIVQIRLNNLEAGTQASVVDPAGGVHASLVEGSSQFDVSMRPGAGLLLRLESPKVSTRRAYSMDISVAEGQLPGPSRIASPPENLFDRIGPQPRVGTPPEVAPSDAPLEPPIPQRQTIDESSE